MGCFHSSICAFLSRGCCEVTIIFWTFYYGLEFWCSICGFSRFLHSCRARQLVLTIIKHRNFTANLWIDGQWKKILLLRSGWARNLAYLLLDLAHTLLDKCDLFAHRHGFLVLMIDAAEDSCLISDALNFFRRDHLRLHKTVSKSNLVFFWTVCICRSGSIFWWVDTWSLLLHHAKIAWISQWLGILILCQLVAWHYY